MQVMNGTYTGNGADARDITSVGFDPDVVLILGNHADANAILKTADMPTNTCKELIASTAIASLPDRLTDLITDGFRVDNHATSNANGVVYWWLALADNGAPDLDVGTYTGDGQNTQAITGVGFQPNMIWIFGAGARVPKVAISALADQGGAWDGQDGGIAVESYDADGFTVGAVDVGDASVNASGETFYYVAFKDTAELVKQSTYTGNGVDDRNIAHGLGTTPTWVMINPDGVAFDTAVWNDDIAAPNSTRVDGIVVGGNRIQAVDGTNVQVGTDTGVNNDGSSYRLMAFAQGESSAIVNPTIVSIVPDNGPKGGGTNVTITGTGFAAGATVTFGGSAATNVQVNGTTEITCRTPQHAPGAVDVVVTNTDTGTVTSSNGFTFNQNNAPGGGGGGRGRGGGRGNGGNGGGNGGGGPRDQGVFALRKIRHHL